MRLRAKLLLGGAVVPAAFLAAVVVLGGWLFRASLLASLDEALRAQASVESVSLFDQETPHLHVPSDPPLVHAAEAASRAVFDARGTRIITAPGAIDVITALPPDTMARTPWLRTRRTPEGIEVRELFVRVVAPTDKVYVLWVAQSLAPIEATVAAFIRTVGGLGVLAIVCLLFLQARFAARLARRIGGLAHHMTLLMAGDLSGRPPDDETADELGALRASIAQATERLDAAKRAQDRLIADAAHELRTPLAALRAHIDVTLRRERSAEELRDAFAELREEVDRLGALATKLLELARGRHVEWRMSPQSIVALARQAIDARRGSAASKSVDVRLTAPDDATASCDPEGMRRAFDNLLANAIEFAPEASRVFVVIEDAGDSWDVCFEDEGPGVPVDEREAIFDPFRRLDTSHAGAGLGLSIVRDIVERHAGRVTVEDGAVGAAFRVSIPKRADRDSIVAAQ